VRAKVILGAQRAGGLKATIFDWAFHVGAEVSKLRQKGREPSGILAVKNAVADKLVFSKLRERFGGRLRFFVSGSAALSREVAEFFHAANILVLEGYGLTETSAASFVNRPDRYRFGTVGLPLPGTQVRMAAEDGEILIRGRGVMRGYHQLPEATRETLEPDGWLRTGDIGAVDAEGFLRITDRKKDLIKTSGGKYIAPQALENKIKTTCPYVSHVLVLGNDRNYCSALVTLDQEAVAAWFKATGGAAGLSYGQLAAEDRVTALIDACIKKVNETLASYETIKKFAVLPADLSVEGGELTASLKIKRRVVEQKYRDVIEAFYEATHVTVGR
jgi:long-chain acyl-CoA synthetase